MKLTEANKKCLKRIVNELAVLKKYSSYDDFFDNSPLLEQAILYTAAWYGGNSMSASKLQADAPDEYKRAKWIYERAVNQNTFRVRENTTNINKLAQLGYIEIVRGINNSRCCELIKVLKEEAE